MAQILVRNLEDRVVEHLKNRARNGGRSLQAEVKIILEQAAASPAYSLEEARAWTDKIRRHFKGRGFPSSVGLIREDRDR